VLPFSFKPHLAFTAQVNVASFVEVFTHKTDLTSFQYHKNAQLGAVVGQVIADTVYVHINNILNTLNNSAFFPILKILFFIIFL